MALKDSDKFKQEYLYIEEIPLQHIEEYKNDSNKKSDENKRGVHIVNIFGDEEDI